MSSGHIYRLLGDLGNFICVMTQSVPSFLIIILQMPHGGTAHRINPQGGAYGMQMQKYDFRNAN